MWRYLIILFTLGRVFSSVAATNFTGLNALEARFRNSLSNCVLSGRWCLIEKGKLTEEYQETYTIQSATKSTNGNWVIRARIQFGGKDVTVPIPVEVRWAGETPVITLDKVSIPGLGAYSARVLLYESTYAGAWSAREHGGMLHGIIERPRTANAKK